MLTKAVGRFIRVSPRKARLVTRLIHGKSVGEALSMLQYSPQIAARLVEKVLRSAIANAEHNHQVRDLDGLRVGVLVDGGPRLKRIQPRAMGRAFWIRHRMSHITVALSEAAESRPRRAAGRPSPGRARGSGRGGAGSPAKAPRATKSGGRAAKTRSA